MCPRDLISLPQKVVWNLNPVKLGVISLSSYNGCKLNSLLTCFQRASFIARLVEHCIRIVEVVGFNPVEASGFFFWAFFATALVASHLWRTLSLLFSTVHICDLYNMHISKLNVLWFISQVTDITSLRGWELRWFPVTQKLLACHIAKSF